ncbi:hypothetical protein DLAC_07697 [Tieghemostelium lacteum]|uniref:Paramecium surface antigen repeat-containing protein n=1 Tax=Tieghemostelium lacteum TaxID=361077 RepID=A0A151ZA53_TIELA|nr:hypothetical protein DLAC_07697 [Tieghemostelium lacteum]|eukprot:KYQ90829.1 hypothetical protein DLAC_07697 [Tieghemostelium lacteum]
MKLLNFSFKLALVMYLFIFCNMTVMVLGDLCYDCVSNGQSCGTDTATYNNVCPGNSQCSTSGNCTALAGKDQSCQQDSDCLPYLSCVETTSGGPKFCRVLHYLSNGKVCNTNSECIGPNPVIGAGSQCVDGHCQDMSIYGCYYDYQCLYSQYCDVSTKDCAPTAGIGATCYSNNNCLSGLCDTRNTVQKCVYKNQGQVDSYCAGVGWCDFTQNLTCINNMCSIYTPTVLPTQDCTESTGVCQSGQYCDCDSKRCKFSMTPTTIQCANSSYELDNCVSTYMCIKLPQLSSKTCWMANCGRQYCQYLKNCNQGICNREYNQLSCNTYIGGGGSNVGGSSSSQTTNPTSSSSSQSTTSTTSSNNNPSSSIQLLPSISLSLLLISIINIVF